MKKLLLAAALLVGFGANAQDTQFQPGGSLEVFYDNMNNYDFSDTTHDRRDEFVQKTKLKLDAAKNDNLTAKLVLTNIMLWGDNSAFDGKDTSMKGEAVKSNQFLVEEAYGVYQMDQETSLQFGRGQYLLGRGEVISKRNEYEYIPVSFDGLLLLHDTDNYRAGAFIVRGVDDGFNLEEGGEGQASNDKSGDFLGATLTFKAVPEFLNDVLVHYINAKSDTFAGNSITKNERTWIGLSTGGETGAFDYNAAYVKFDGTVYGTSEIDRDGSMMQLGAGFNMPEVMGLRIGVEYHQDSGDESGSLADGKSETYDPLYYDFNKYAGRMEIAKWGCTYANNNVANTCGSTSAATPGSLNGAGLTSLALRLKVEPSAGLKVMLDYFMFEATEDQGSDEELGSEIDLVVEKSYDNGFYANALYGMFQAGDRLGNNADDAERLLVNFGFDF